MAGITAGGVNAHGKINKAGKLYSTGAAHHVSMRAGVVAQETEPMGTAGPLKLAEEILADGSGDPFFVLNR